MRILLSTFGSRGDVEPMAGLGRQLQVLGAKARVCAPTDKEFTTLLERAGVPITPAFTSVRTWVEMARNSNEGLRQRATRMIKAQYEAILTAAEGCDAIVATGLFPSVAAAQSVAEKLGKRYYFASFCPLLLPSHHHTPFEYPGQPHPVGVNNNKALWCFDAQVVNALFGDLINDHRASIGLPRLENVRDHLLTSRPLLASDPVLSPWRQSDLADAVQMGAWILPDERPLPADLLTFLDAGSPPIYVGFGSMPMETLKQIGKLAVETIRSQGRRAIILRGWAELEPADAGEDCFVVHDVNQQRLFQRVAAAIHHGGAGTTTTAARAGVPQMIVPQVVDQPYWGARVAELGIGVIQGCSGSTTGSLASGLAKLVSPEMREKVEQVSEYVRSDGAETAARLLLSA